MGVAMLIYVDGLRSFYSKDRRSPVMSLPKGIARGPHLDPESVNQS
jgi:hypothetical protein